MAEFLTYSGINDWHHYWFKSVGNNLKLIEKGVIIERYNNWKKIILFMKWLLFLSINAVLPADHSRYSHTDELFHRANSLNKVVSDPKFVR